MEIEHPKGAVSMVKEEFCGGDVRNKRIKKENGTSDYEDDNDAYEQEEYEEPSQVTLSQADEHIRQLDKEGELTEVVGSQSMLSQELKFSSQRDEADDEEEEVYPDMACSQQTETSISMAHRLGVLTQETLTQDTIDGEGKGRESQRSRTALLSAYAKLSESEVDEAVQQAEMDITDVALSQEDVPLSQDPVCKVDSRYESDSAVKPTSSVLSCRSIAMKTCRSKNIHDSCEGVSKVIGQIVAQKGEVCSNRPTIDSKGDADYNPQEASGSAQQQKAQCSKRKQPDCVSDLTTPQTRKRVKTGSQRTLTEMNVKETAKRAAALAEQTVTDPDMAKRLLLSMALVRENPRTAPSSWPARGSVVPSGFFWAHYPPLEGGTSLI